LSLKENNSTEDDCFFSGEVEELTPKEMIGFRLRTDKLYDSYTSSLVRRVYNGGGCSDDGFE
jgi:hypothetical protein